MPLTEARERLLASSPNAILATLRRDGSPQLSPVWYLWEKGHFLVAAGSRTAKVHNLRRDPRAALCIDDPKAGQYVTATGTVELVDGAQAREPILRLIRKYRQPEDVLPHWESITAVSPYTLIILRPKRMVWPDW